MSLIDQADQLRKQQAECDHHYTLVDDISDHKYGTDIIRYWQCEHCEMTKNIEPGDTNLPC